ncbi:DUF2637 domain-containing protein [Pseudonocardia hispaniensis]|uniref:DUF2637 domain-containing protein n=1 Tax=Pseudonocardia hispaniensis TaxID=904933 RepID=A0ABW1J8D0_9PSEU
MVAGRPLRWLPPRLLLEGQPVIRRIPLYGLMVIVAVCAAVLSFSALRDLALLCGFTAELAPMLPIVVDAGAAAGSIIWLGRASPGGARSYGRALALILLSGSVGGNALGHGLAAYSARPHWLVVVAVSAIAPATLAALVHLAVLVGRASPAITEESVMPDRTDIPIWHPVHAPVPAMPAETEAERDVASAAARTLSVVPSAGDEQGDDLDGRAAALVAAGAGRRRLARELAISEHEARQLLARLRGRVAS